MLRAGVDELSANSLIENSVDGIFLLDNEFKILSWNKQMHMLSGSSISEVRGKLIFKELTVFNDLLITEALKSALSERGFILKELIQPFNNEDQYQVSISAFTFPDIDSKGLMITLRKANEVGWKSRFKPLVEESPIPTAIFDTDGSTKYFNPAYGMIWGVEKELLYHIVDVYNVKEDAQLKKLGVQSFVDRAFQGEACELPTILFNPINSPSMAHFGIDEPRHIKGQFFPINHEDGKINEVVLVLNDVTFQKQAEEVLSETNLKFERITQGLPGVIYEYEEEGAHPHTFRYLSEGYREIYGLTPEEATNDASVFEALIHPDDMAAYNESVLSSREDNAEWYWSGRIVVDSEIKWIEGKSTAVRLSDNSLVRYGLLLDITEKKRAEVQHKIAEDRLQIALSGADLGLWEWELNKGKQLLNHSWSQKLGYDFKEFNRLFKDRTSLIHPEDVKEFNYKTKRFSTGKDAIVEVEYRMRSKNGDWIWVQDRGSVLEKNKKGKVTKAAGTLLDIHVNKVSQQIIKQNELLFTQLFENAPMGVVLLNEGHEVVQMNQGFENLFGFSKEEIIGNQLNNIIVPQENIKEAIDINSLTAEGVVGTLESRRLHKNGQLIPVIIYGVPVSFDNKTIGIYGIYVNIEERIKVEKELKIRNDELDNFVYKVSHDLRAPLSSILGLTNLASLEQNEDDLKEYIYLIENRVKQLDTFINDVLSHSKNLKMELQISKIDFKEIVDEAYSELNYLPNAERILRKFSVDGAEFKSDYWRIKELFRNLISNAIKYADITKDCSFVAIDILISKDHANVRVEDNGIGIGEEAQSQIFDMFYRATNKAEGSGIGLYIVKNAVEKLGGTVQLESTLDKGTIFDIILPNSL